MMTSPALTPPQDEPASTRWSPGRRSSSVVFVLVLAIVVRLVARDEVAAASSTFAPVGEGESIVLQALRVAAGHDIVEGVTFQPPLYPWMLGLAARSMGVTGSTTAQGVDELTRAQLAATLRLGRALNFGLGLIVVLLVMALARRAFGDAAATWAGVLAALYGPFVFYEGLAMKETLSLLVLPLAALAATAALRAQARRDEGSSLWFVCGLALGAGGLVRGNMLGVGWLCVLLVLLRGGAHHDLRAGIRDAGSLAAGLLLAVAPVAVRNSVVAGRPVLLTAAAGTALYSSNQPGNDTGLVPYVVADRAQPRRAELDWSFEAKARSGRTLSPSEVSEYWLNAALVGNLKQPLPWMLAELRKVFLLFTRYEVPDDVLPALAEPEVPFLRWTPSRYAVVLPLALGGLWLGWRRRERGALAGARSVMTLLLVLYAGTLLIFTVNSQFRLPMVPLLLVSAGYLLSELRTVLAGGWRGEGGRAAAVVGLGLFLGWASESPLGPLSPGRLALDWSTSLRNRAEVKVGRDDPEAARRDLLTAVDTLRAAGLDEAALHASLARLDRVAARQLAVGGDAAQPRARELLDAAKKELATATALDADDATVLREKGLLQFDEGQETEALETLTLARGAQPRDREVLQHLALVQLRLGNGQAAQEPARALLDIEPHADDGWGLLALGLLQDGNVAEAREAVARYDSEARAREAQGLARRLPESPEFAALRPQPPPPP
ncbi:MAG TPA: hypothetical protein VFY71_16215 [Planctomycetota bacterium]|nr:hypothetical protein [Planctomycetota bacterium]